MLFIVQYTLPEPVFQASLGLVTNKILSVLCIGVLFIMEDDDNAAILPTVVEKLEDICVICPHKSYVKPDEILTAKRDTLKRKLGVDSCNKFAKKRKMNIIFKVSLF